MGHGATSFSQTGSRMTTFFTILNTFFVVLALGAFIAMSVILHDYNTTLQRDEKNCQDEVKTNNQVDIAIIGAGAAGTYAAWKLSQQYPDKRIHLFEYNGRVGGRLYSVHIPSIGDFKADMGAMRFYREWHTLTFKAIDELGLSVINFTTPTNDEKLYYLRGQYLLQEHIDNGDVPYALTDEERNASGRTDVMLATWNQKFIIPGENDKLQRKTVDDKNVWNLGRYNEWLKYGSKEALQFISDISGFYDWVFGNSNLADMSDTEYEETPTPWPQYLTLKDGTDALPITMVNRFLEVNTRNNKLHLHEELMTINSTTANISLTFRNTQTKQLTMVTASDVILATGQEAIRRLDWPDRTNHPDLDHQLSSQIDIPAYKLFLAYDYPWWRNGGKGWAFDDITNSGNQLKYLVTDLPLRMLIDIGEDKSTGKSLLLVYNDMHDNLNFWKSPLETDINRDPTAVGGMEFTPTVELINLTQTYLSTVFNLSENEIPKPYASATQAWYGAPYHGAWHMWKQGYRYTDVQDSVLKPLSERNIYVIGEAYSDSLQQGWIEGAYDRAEAMLGEYFSNSAGFGAGGMNSRRKSLVNVAKSRNEPFPKVLMRH